MPLAQEALLQIEDKMYDTQMKTDGIKNIVKIGIAFRGKQAVVKTNKEK
ncbi:MAG: PD-(D/E)XK nuclease domain-containing protein [Anaeroplasma sp.]